VSGERDAARLSPMPASKAGPVEPDPDRPQDVQVPVCDCETQTDSTCESVAELVTPCPIPMPFEEGCRKFLTPSGMSSLLKKRLSPSSLVLDARVER
jgi:hypothetical protein